MKIDINWKRDTQNTAVMACIVSTAVSLSLIIL